MPGATRMLDKTLAIVMAGGGGTRLRPLTEHRAKPAVPFGGKYRIIDFTLTNCLHSGLRRVLVLTQYKSHSLQKHLRDGWSIFNPELGEYITPVPPQMRAGESWYSGTADSVYQNRDILERSGAEYVLILSGDHIYRMDYNAMLKAHRDTGAAVTIACMETPIDQARSLGVVGVDETNRLTAFHEKPEKPVPLLKNPDLALVSMGIYVFSMKLLLECLEEDHAREHSGHDFGKNILPSLIRSQHVHAYVFGGEQGRVTADRYWRDVGNLDSLFEANMELLEPIPPMDLYQDSWPIRSYQAQCPPARTAPGKWGNEGIFINSIAGGGVVISGGTVKHSVLFPKVYVGEEAIVDDAILFDNVRIEERAQVRRCIIDKNAVVPSDQRVGYDLEHDRARFTVTDQGVVVVPKGYCFS